MQLLNWHDWIGCNQVYANGIQYLTYTILYGFQNHAYIDIQI